MSYKSCAFSENVRPLIVLACLDWLIKHSDLYKNTNIALDPDWKRIVTESKSDEAEHFVCNTSDNLLPDGTHSESCNENGSKQDLYDSDAEEVVQENVGNIDTLLDDANIENRNATFTFAPGEGQSSKHIFQTEENANETIK